MTVVINGNTGISGTNGSAGTPAVQGEDTNTGIFFPAADTVAVATAGAERLRVDSSGNVGIGTTDPTTLGGGSKLTVNQGADGNIVFARGGSVRQVQLGTSSTMGYINADNTSGGLGLNVNGTERARIDSSGNLLLGGGSTVYAKFTVTNNTGHSRAVDMISGASGYFDRFLFNGVDNGSITLIGGGVSYNTTSDYRRKENILPLSGASNLLAQIPVYTFNYIDYADRTISGFLAHEVQAVVPEAVTGFKDEVDDEGNPKYQGIDQSKLVPLLTAALQEALAEIANLKTRVAQLEAQ